MHRSAEPLIGVPAYALQLAVTPGEATEHHDDQPSRAWNPNPLNRTSFCLRVAPASRSYAPENVVNGLVRPFGAPNVWLSAHRDDDPESWPGLTWPRPRRLGSDLLTFNDDLNEGVSTSITTALRSA